MIEPSSEVPPDPAGQARPDCVLPAGDVFLADGPTTAPAETRPAATTGATGRVEEGRPVPGLLESIAWIFGMLVIQFGVLILTIVLFLWYGVSRGDIDLSRSGPIELANQLQTTLKGELLTSLGVSQLATIAYGLLAIQWRIRPAGILRLGWRFPRLFHWLLVGLLMPPMWLLSSSLFNVVLKWMPWAADSLKGMTELIAGAPVWLSVLVIGMGPAVAEELLFRAFIGRGLVGRRGLIPGMVITSILFGLMHLHPVQALGVIPLGFALHFVYFTTRSFWAPMTLHFLNNSLSVLWVQLGAEGTRLDKLVEADSDLPLHILVVSIAMVASIALILWQTRVRYILSDGTAWNPGFVSSETPPAAAGAVAMRHRASSLVLAAGAISTLGFAAALWLFATGG